MNHYDDEKHIYTMGGAIVPSVTRIVPKPDFFCTPEQLEAAREDGEENHSMIKMYWDTLETFGDPMLEALAAWVDENRALVGDMVLYEKPLYSERHRYAGKPDAIFSKAVIDFKRTFGNKRLHALQTAGYHALATENKIIPKTKTHLILVYNGKVFKAKNVYDPQAEAVFLSLVKKYYIEEELKKWMNKN